MKLLHTREARIVEGQIRTDGTEEAVLLIEGKPYGVLEATEAGLHLIDASDEERQHLVDAGYALPSHVGEVQEEDG